MVLQLVGQVEQGVLDQLHTRVGIAGAALALQVVGHAAGRVDDQGDVVAGARLGSGQGAADIAEDHIIAGAADDVVVAVRSGRYFDPADVQGEAVLAGGVHATIGGAAAVLHGELEAGLVAGGAGLVGQLALGDIAEADGRVGADGHAIEQQGAGGRQRLDDHVLEAVGLAGRGIDAVAEAEVRRLEGVSAAGVDAGRAIGRLRCVVDRVDGDGALGRCAVLQP
ncbi:hypothetical protein D3C84_502970 [compost metagenome]